MVRRVVPTLVLLLVVAGCSSAAEDAMGGDLCVNRVVRAVLTVDVDDPQAIWATTSAGITIPLRLPDGYGVTDDNRIVDADGVTIGQTGDVIVGGCSDLLENALLITEEDIRHEP
jgi:hypothetical protein